MCDCTTDRHPGMALDEPAYGPAQHWMNVQHSARRRNPPQAFGAQRQPAPGARVAFAGTPNPATVERRPSLRRRTSSAVSSGAASDEDPVSARCAAAGPHFVARLPARAASRQTHLLRRPAAKRARALKCVPGQSSAHYPPAPAAKHVRRSVARARSLATPGARAARSPRTPRTGAQARPPRPRSRPGRARGAFPTLRGGAHAEQLHSLIPPPQELVALHPAGRQGEPPRLRPRAHPPSPPRSSTPPAGRWAWAPTSSACPRGLRCPRCAPPTLRR